MSKTTNTADLPAPLSLTLEQATEVGGGFALAGMTSVMPHWLWFGQPPVVALTGLQTVSLP